MDYRLGMFECPACGNQQTKAEETKQSTSGPGFRKEAWKQQSTPTAAPAGAPKLYAIPEEEEEKPKGPLTQLDKEKRIYFWITAALTTIGILATVGGLFTGRLSGGYVLNDIFWELVYLFALSFVLFGGETWAKGACGVLLMLDLLAMILTPVIFLPMVASMTGSSSIIPSCLGIPFIFSLLISAGWTCWLLWILWRDIQSEGSS